MAQRRSGVSRQTVDLSGFPDLVVIYLGMRVRSVRGLAKLVRTGRQIQAGVAEDPDGLLLHENMVFSQPRQFPEALLASLARRSLRWPLR